jgi:hypothetical protein
MGKGVLYEKEGAIGKISQIRVTPSTSREGIDKRIKRGRPNRLLQLASKAQRKMDSAAARVWTVPTRGVVGSLLEFLFLILGQPKSFSSAL